MNRRQFISVVSMYLIGLLLIWFYISTIISVDYIYQYDLLVIVLFLVIALFSYVMIIFETKKYAYSLNLIHWLYIFFFYGIAAFVQYLNEKFVYVGQISLDVLLYVQIMIILWMIFYLVGSVTRKKAVVFKSVFYKEFKPNYRFILICTILSVIIVVYFANQVDFLAGISRSNVNQMFQKDTTAETLIFTSIMRNVVLYGLVITIMYYQKTGKGKLLLIIQLFSTFIVNNPFGMARFNVAIVYLGLILLLFSRIRKSRVFVLLFFIGFIFLFPFINIFRHVPVNELSLGLIFKAFDEVLRNFLHGDYDAFSMIANTKLYIDSNGITYGYQLLGALLFFIPRSLWDTKPVGSGHTVRIYQEETFTNVSSPLIAEGLINFGIFGVIIFALIVGKVMNSIDRSYWTVGKNRKLNHNYLYGIYPFLLSMFFFMNRGDLISTFSFAMSHIIIYTMMFYLNNFPEFRKDNG